MKKAPRRGATISGPERLEARTMLAGDGLLGVPFTVTGDNGQEVQVAWNPTEDDQITVNGAFETIAGRETVTARLGFNDFTVTNFEGDTATGSTSVPTPLGLSPGLETQAVLADVGEQLLAQFQRTEAALASGPFVDSPPTEFQIGSIDLETELAGRVSISAAEVFRPFSAVSVSVLTADASVGSRASITASVDALLQSPLVNPNGVATIRVDFGDGTAAEREVQLGPSLVNATERFLHTYSESGDYTVTVSGVAPLRNGLGGISFRQTCTLAIIRIPVEEVGGPGADTIVLRNEGGRLIANTNGVDRDLGASDEVTAVRVDPGGGSNVVDGRGLLPTQTLIVPPISGSGPNTVFGGPGDDVLNGSNGPDQIQGGAGQDIIVPRDGADTVDGQGGSDTVRIGGTGFPFAFVTDVKTLIGGESPGDQDTVEIVDGGDDLDVFASTLTNDGNEGLIRMFLGGGSFAPQVDALLREFERLEILEQSESLFLNFISGDFFESVSVTGSNEGDTVNLENFTGGPTQTWTLNGADRVFGSDQSDFIDTGTGDDEAEGGSGNDTFVDNAGTNEFDGGPGDDTYRADLAFGAALALDITDNSGGADRLDLSVSDETTGGLAGGLQLDASTTQAITDDATIQLNGFVPPIENVTIRGNGELMVTGSSSNNEFKLVPDPRAGDLRIIRPPLDVKLSDGPGGDDQFSIDDIDFPNPGEQIPPGFFSEVFPTPNSGDVIDLGESSTVTVNYRDAFRAVTVDLDRRGVDQVVDALSNTTRFDSPIRNFGGSAFDDTLLIDATTLPRTIDGGDGTDTVTIDAQGRPVSQTIGGAVTTVSVAGFAPIVISAFETINVVNDTPAGQLRFDLTPGDDTVRLDLESFLTDGVESLGLFALSETTGGFALSSFLHGVAPVEVHSGGGTDTITVSLAGRQFEVIDDTVQVAGLAPIRLVGFTEVTIENAGVPGDYNADGRVNAIDYTVWRDSQGAQAGTLPNDVDGGSIGEAQYATWAANFGRIRATFAAPLTAPAQSSFPVESLGDPTSEVSERAIDAAFGGLFSTTRVAGPSVRPTTNEVVDAMLEDDRDLLLVEANAATQGPQARRRPDANSVDEDPVKRTDPEAGWSSLGPGIRLNRWN